MTRQTETNKTNKNNGKVRIKMNPVLLKILRFTWIPVLCVVLFTIGMQVGISYIWEAGDVRTDPVLNTVSAVWGESEESEEGYIVSFNWTKNEELAAEVVKDRDGDTATLSVKSHDGSTSSFDVGYETVKDEDDVVIQRYLTVNGDKVRSVEGDEMVVQYNLPGDRIEYNLFSKEMWSGFWDAIKNF
ncbi:hypothetical protein PRVXH_001200 [Proteinivorax hydrogeniformans]|uniref:Uncharacterized protein n=1 Tax=Proteinivorax hydrogeniformans TaxID=1826727 RepID=A0AAU8HWW3_9FIRM